MTSAENALIVEHNQPVANSHFYEPGPYTRMEAGATRICAWYLNENR